MAWCHKGAAWEGVCIDSGDGWGVSWTATGPSCCALEWQLAVSIEQQRSSVCAQHQGLLGRPGMTVEIWVSHCLITPGQQCLQQSLTQPLDLGNTRFHFQIRYVWSHGGELSPHGVVYGMYGC